MAIASQRTDNWSYQHVNDRMTLKKALENFWKRMLPSPPGPVDRPAPVDRAFDHARALEAAQKLGLEIEDTQAMLDSIAATRLHASTAGDQTLNQLLVIKERVNHLSDQLDAILELLGAPRLSASVAAQP
jgi:hypothetical protein